jgi:hypothetical protein
MTTGTGGSDARSGPQEPTGQSRPGHDPAGPPDPGSAVAASAKVGAGPDALEVLAGEHAEIQALFARVSRVDEDRPAVLEQIMQRLSDHLDMEKHTLVPVLEERLDDGGVLARQLREAHDRARRILLLLERRKVNSPDVPDLVTELMDITDAHVRQAETDLEPRLRRASSSEELAQLGAAMLSDERRSLSHSHPMVPANGPIAAIGHKLAEVVDDLRAHTSEDG